LDLYVIPAFYAIFVWWFATGAMIYLDGLPQHTFRASFIGASVLGLVGAWCVAVTQNDMSVGGAYLAFTGAMLVWAWLEMSFYLGLITGTRRTICAPGCGGWRHFGHALAACWHHELLSVLLAGALALLSWGGDNQIALWTYLVMWLMTLSAKLNVFLGVRNLNEEFLPEHLWFLKSFFRKKPINLYFPFAVTISTAIWVVMLDLIVNPAAPAALVVGLTLVATQMGLAILEHWLLVLPLPANLWAWSLKAREQKAERARLNAEQ
jgi:putative photosynthetic complex assembly protein 2